MKLRGASLQVNEKKSLSHFPSRILPSFSHHIHDYYESEPAQFLSGSISGK